MLKNVSGPAVPSYMTKHTFLLCVEGTFMPSEQFLRIESFIPYLGKAFISGSGRLLFLLSPLATQPQ